MTMEELQKKLDDTLAELSNVKQASAKGEELQKTVEKLQGDIGKLVDQNSQLTNIVNNMRDDTVEKPASRNGREENPYDPVTQPREFSDWITNQAATRATRSRDDMDNARRAADAVKARFYALHPELKPFEPVVSWFTQHLLAENPNVSEQEGFKLVSERASAYVKEHFTGGKPLAPPAPHVGPGGPKKEEPPAPKAEEPEPYDPEKATKETISELRKNQAKGMTADPYRAGATPMK